MVLVKQYLENSWYRWGSQDRQTWYGSQYQFWYWVNTRDMKNWVCLAWWVKSTTTYDGKATYFVYQGKLYALTSTWKIVDTASWSTKLTWLTWWWNLKQQCAVEFWAWVFCALWWKVRVVVNNNWSWSKVDITDTVLPWFGSVTCMLNYANTFLLIWDWDSLWRIDVSLWTEIWKKIRKFHSWYKIYWLTLEWNYLKIYTSNGKDTKIHYAKWTFDVEDTWLIQTISFKWMWLSFNNVASDQWKDYALFLIWNDLKLSRISWYNKVDIKWTQSYWNRWDVWCFYSVNDPYVYASDGVLFVWIDEWIWTFTEDNWWLWWWCLEFPSSNYEEISCIMRYWEELYVCYVGSNTYTEKVYDLSFQPSVYQSNWYIIWRVFDGWCWSLFKKNIQTVVTYNMPSNTKLELSYRYDRKTFWYAKSNFKSLKVLTDTSSCYDIIVPTTDNDFNMPRNYIEYRVDFITTSNSKSPILFEHNLLYNDSMRKYR